MRQETPADRQNYKKFLKDAIEKVKKTITELEDFKPYPLRKPDPDKKVFIDLSNKITELKNQINQEDRDFALAREKKYLTILETKYREYKTHFQREIYSCLVCGEKECICEELQLSKSELPPEPVQITQEDLAKYGI